MSPWLLTPFKTFIVAAGKIGLMKSAVVFSSDELSGGDAVYDCNKRIRDGYQLRTDAMSLSLPNTSDSDSLVISWYSVPTSKSGQPNGC